jgi:enolase
MPCTEQLKIDHAMINLDVTPEKRILGAKRHLALSWRLRELPQF